MKKIRIGSIEVLGYTGIVVWIAVIFLREYSWLDNETYLFFLGILPNLGAAWAATMLGKWLCILVWKRDLTIRIYLFICTGVFVLALGSEAVHDLFLNSPFDIYDILITMIAQIFIFFAPIVTKDKYFGGSGELAAQKKNRVSS